ncbi:MAG: carboxypeptidase-like regulatory domain-containing protein [Planctomycetota bacterium]|jgi:hypothetical protein
MNRLKTRWSTRLLKAPVIFALAVMAACTQTGTENTAQNGESTTTTDPTVVSDATTASIRGQSFTGSFDDAGALVLSSRDTNTAFSVMQLFDLDPAEVPESGWLSISPSSLSIGTSADAQSSVLPLNGSATLRILIAPGSSGSLCDDAVLMGEYNVLLTTGIASIQEARQNLTEPVLQAIAGNRVTICTEVTADFDGELTLTDFELTFDDGVSVPTFLLENSTASEIALLLPGELFGPETTLAPGQTRVATFDESRFGEAIEIRAGLSTEGVETISDCPAVVGTNYVGAIRWDGTELTCAASQDELDGTEDHSDGMMQVPIDNDFGIAIATPVTDTIDNVDYAIVGVLEDGMDSTSFDRVVAVDLETLGLESVETIHMATFSNEVPDLDNGVQIATVTIGFENTAETATVPLVLGEETADWSHGRPEHMTALGGVRHDKGQTLYTFETTIASETQYNGEVFALSIDFDPPRKVATISLELAGTGELGLRSEDVVDTAMTGQSIPAITLVGSIVGSAEDPGTDPDGSTGEDGTGTGGEGDPPEEDPGETEDGGEEQVAVGSASGTVLDAVTGEPVSGVTVNVDFAVATAITDAAGTFLIEGIETGARTLDVSLAGYVPITTTIVVPEGEVQDTTFEMFKAGTVTGTVVNAQTGEALQGVTISIDGTNATTATNATGQFTMTTAPEGSRTVSAARTGFVTASVPVTISPTEPAEVSIGLLAISGGGNGVAITLAWGQSPRDLDLHVSGPDGAGRFHVAYYALNPVAYASLDLDDTSSFGPETVTVSSQNGAYVAGTYAVWVHNFSDEAEFDVSSGVITVFAGGLQVAQYQVEDATGDAIEDIWRVVEFTVAADGTISDINPFQSYEAGSSQSAY